MPAGSYDLGQAEGLIRIKYDGTGTTQAKHGLGEVETAGRRTSAGLDTAAARIGIAGAAIAASLAYASTKAIDFEKQISAIGAVSGATKPEMEALRQKALQLGADTSFSATEAALAMEELAKAGIALPDILNGAADATVALAAAGSVALPEAATIAANAMNAFGLSAKDLPKVVDLIAGAANASAIDVGQFGMSLQQAGAVANLAGVPFSDLAVAIALMGNAGIKGSDAGTSLKTFLQNLIPVTKEQVALMRALGLVTKEGGNQFFDASGKAKSLADISALLQGALKGMGKEQQLATLQTLFGSDSIRAAAILADAGSTGFNNLAASMGKISAEAVAAQRLDNTAGALERMKGSVETAAISVGTLLLPGITSLANKIASLANWINGLSPGWKTFIVNSLGATAALLLTAAAILKVVSTARAISGVVAAMKAWTIWTKLATVAQAAFNIVQLIGHAIFIASPIGWIVLAIAALVAIVILVIKYHKEIWAWIQKVWSGFLNLIKPVTDWFAGPFANFFVQAWNKVVGAFNVAKNAVMAVINFIIGGFKFWLSIVKGVLGFFAPLFQAAFGLVMAIIKTVVSIITAIFAVWFAIWDATIGSSLRAIFAIFSWAFNAILGVITGVFNFLWPYISAILSAIWSVISGTWNGIVQVAVAVWGFIVGYITNQFNFLWAVISFIGSLVWSFLKAIWTSVSNDVSAAWNFVVAIIQGVWDFILGILKAAIDKMASAINGISKIVSKVGEFFGQLKAAAEGGIGSLWAFVSGIPGRILSALGNIGSTLYNSGKAIIQGLIDGIVNMAGNVKDAVNGVLKKARDLLPFSPAKEGPFSGKGWTMYSGRAMMIDLANGILRSRAKVQDAMSGLLGGANNSLSLAVAGVAPATLAGAPAFASSPTSVGASVGSGALMRDVIVNVPAAIVDPDQIATYSARRITTAMATGQSSSNIG